MLPKQDVELRACLYQRQIGADDDLVEIIAAGEDIVMRAAPQVTTQQHPAVIGGEFHPYPVRQRHLGDRLDRGVIKRVCLVTKQSDLSIDAQPSVAQNAGQRWWVQPLDQMDARDASVRVQVCDRRRDRLGTDS